MRAFVKRVCDGGWDNAEKKEEKKRGKDGGGGDQLVVVGINTKKRSTPEKPHATDRVLVGEYAGVYVQSFQGSPMCTYERALT